MSHAENYPNSRAKQAGPLGRCFRVGAAVLFACSLATGAPQVSAARLPLALEKSIALENVPVGPYSDYMSLDLAHGRLFATPQAAKAVAVVDLKTDRVVKMLPVGNPHGSFYSQALDRLFVADGASGGVKVFSGEDYSLIKTIPLSGHADGMAYDHHSKIIYVINGGADAKMDYSLISAIDPVRMQKVADIRMASLGLEGMAIDPAKEIAYTNLDEDDHAVAVVDLGKRQTVGTWKIPGEHRDTAIALDVEHHRLYIASQDSPMHGSIIVLDATNGHLVATLPIGGWADGLSIDQKRRRIYVSTGTGYVDTYAIEGKDNYRRLAPVETAVMAKTSVYSSKLDRLFVDVPHIGNGSADGAKVMVFKPVQ